jgi:hypothetical protein
MKEVCRTADLEISGRYAIQIWGAVVTARVARHDVGECDSSSLEEVGVVGNQTVWKAARRAASQV